MQSTILIRRPCAAVHPLSAEHYPDCAACRMRLENSTTARHFRALWREPEPAPRPLTAPPVVRVKPCIHLGQPTGELVGCATCTGKVRLKVFSCAKYGKCLTAKSSTGIQSCDGCPTYTPRTTRQILVTSRGIGDLGMMLTASAGLLRDHPADEVLLVLPQNSLLPQEPWLALFGGYSRVSYAPEHNVTTYRPYDSYSEELNEHTLTRCQYYARACETTPVLPPVNPLLPAAVSWAEQYRGAVVLAPWAAYTGRVWDHTSWLQLERSLIERGRRVVVIDNQTDRCEHFAGAKVLGKSAAEIAALFRASACVVANQSGMAVIAGLLNVKTVVLNGPIHGRHLWPEFPSVHWLDGHLPCGDCHWRGAVYERKRHQCERVCESLSTISPGEVLSAIADLLSWRKSLSLGPAPASVRREVTLTVPQGIGDAFWAWQVVSPHYDRVNLNIATIDGAVNQLSTRAVDWLAMLPKVGAITAESVTHDRYLATARGHPEFPADGGCHDFAVNAYLESGMRIEDIYPDREVAQWIDPPTEYTPKAPRSPFLLAYLSGASMRPEVIRDVGIWTPAEWSNYLAMFLDYVHVSRIILIGASYDEQAASTVARLLPDCVVRVLIDLPPVQVLYLMRRCSYFVGYQSGLNVMADQIGARQHMLYFPSLWRMRYSWCRPAHVRSRLVASVFDAPERVIGDLTRSQEWSD